MRTLKYAKIDGGLLAETAGKSYLIRPDFRVETVVSWVGMSRQTLLLKQFKTLAEAKACVQSKHDHAMKKWIQMATFTEIKAKANYTGVN